MRSMRGRAGRVAFVLALCSLLSATSVLATSPPRLLIPAPPDPGQISGEPDDGGGTRASLWSGLDLYVRAIIAIQLGIPLSGHLAGDVSVATSQKPSVAIERDRSTSRVRAQR